MILILTLDQTTETNKYTQGTLVTVTSRPKAHLFSSIFEANTGLLDIDSELLGVWEIKEDLTDRVKRVKISSKVETNQILDNKDMEDIE